MIHKSNDRIVEDDNFRIKKVGAIGVSCQTPIFQVIVMKLNSIFKEEAHIYTLHSPYELEAAHGHKTVRR